MGDELAAPSRGAGGRATLDSRLRGRARTRSSPPREGPASGKTVRWLPDGTPPQPRLPLRRDLARSPVGYTCVGRPIAPDPVRRGGALAPPLACPPWPARSGGAPDRGRPYFDGVEIFLDGDGHDVAGGGSRREEGSKWPAVPETYGERNNYLLLAASRLALPGTATTTASDEGVLFLSPEGERRRELAGAAAPPAPQITSTSLSTGSGGPFSGDLATRAGRHVRRRPSKGHHFRRDDGGEACSSAL